VADDLRPLWSFDDLDASEARFRALLGGEPDASRRGEVLTQLARVEGLRGRFDAADGLLDEAAACDGASGRLRARIALERGRVRRSCGDQAAALPLFEQALSVAEAADEPFIAVDAIHMVALVVPDHAGRIAWTRRGIEQASASSDDAVRYWLGPLSNNLGWEHSGAGEHEAALAAFEAALTAYSTGSGRPDQVAVARYALGRALRLVDRSAEALPLLEQADAWAEASGTPDGWFCEELALEHDALGNGEAACQPARRALELLPAADPSFAADEERRARLARLAR
jgi:tetratricopeptide (TPR) repeat protein